MVQPRPLLADADANANAFDGGEPGEFYLDISITTPVHVRPHVWAAWNRSIHRAPLRRLPVIGSAWMSSAALMRRALSRASCHLHLARAAKPHLRRDSAPPRHWLHRDAARACHICAGTDVARCMACRLWCHSQCAARSTFRRCRVCRSKSTFSSARTATRPRCPPSTHRVPTEYCRVPPAYGAASTEPTVTAAACIQNTHGGPPLSISAVRSQCRQSAPRLTGASRCARPLWVRVQASPSAAVETVASRVGL